MSYHEGKIDSVLADPSPVDPLEIFSPATATWFREVFARPTPAQVGAWQAIAAGENALVIAPTGSGKTLAAFLWALDELTRSPAPLGQAALPGALRLAAEGAGGRRRA